VVVAESSSKGEPRCRWRKSNIFRWLNSGLTFKSLTFSGEKLWKLVPLAPRFTQAETGCARRPPPTLLWARTGRSGTVLIVLKVVNRRVYCQSVWNDWFKKPKCWTIELIGKSWITSKSSKRRLMIYSLRQKCSEHLYAMKSNDGTIFIYDRTWYFIGPIWANLNVSAGWDKRYGLSNSTQLSAVIPITRSGAMTLADVSSTQWCSQCKGGWQIFFWFGVLYCPMGVLVLHKKGLGVLKDLKSLSGCMWCLSWFAAMRKKQLLKLSNWNIQYG